MKKIAEILSRLFFKNRRRPEGQNVDQLRMAFKERYHHFKLLLSANKRALQKMADIERAIHGDFDFGMSFVRDRCTSTSINVLQMIKHIDALAPEKYAALYSGYTTITRSINDILNVKPPHIIEKNVVLIDALDQTMVELVGNKMAVLGELKNRLHLNVPPGFAITTYAYEQFFRETGLRDEINRLIQSADIEKRAEIYQLSNRIRQQILQTELPAKIASDIQTAWATLQLQVGASLKVAIRSSAIGEDAVGRSFAGQYSSALNVNAEDLLSTYKWVIASKYNPHAMIYRLQQGIRDEDIPMAVGCLKMVDAVAGGVVYSGNPVPSEADAIIINCVWGLPKTVVDGTDACDLFVLSKTAPHALLHEEIREKRVKYQSCETDSGLCRENVESQMASAPSITENQREALTQIALSIEHHNAQLQDIEWAIDSTGDIYVLQSRPLQRKAYDGTSKPSSLVAPSETVVAAGGVTASSGAACGKVFFVEKHADAIRFPKGAVLVTRQALPAWAALVDRAVAVVTAQGGVAGHLASVAREFGVPAIFGIGDNLAKLVSGEQITVDADHRTIYAGCVASLLKDAATPRLDFLNRPVYQLLKKAGDWIVPLHLLDPDSRDFKPENCRTYHDITRFIHEKSVFEMFNFGRDHSFPERSGKQLYYRVPMQWWVLNLDDGFTEEVTGKYVKFENIASIPMLAFWEGFAKVPWDGPPAIDRKGLVSVMFQSTTNPALVTGVRSRFAEQNYFMISKYFCSLNSRLGYHFSTLEALVSDRARENYISFQFKGGAADYQRRTGRAQLIGDILAHYGFFVTLREDYLSARLQDENLDYMTTRLAILGYLTLHTRQLDMIMSNPTQVTYYKSKFKADIQSHFLK